MRLVRIVLLSIAAAALSPPGDATVASRCGPPHGPTKVRLALPAPLRVTHACATFVVSPAGRIRVSAAPRPAGGSATSMAVAGAGAPVVPQAGGRIAVLARGRTVFRSRGRFRAAGVFATAGPGAVTFGYDDFTRRRERTDLYLAPFGGRERLVAGGESPLGWTAAGDLVAWRFGGSISVYLRDQSGRLLRRVGGRLREIRFDPETHSPLALSSGGMLERYRGGRWRRVASLAALVLDRRASFERLAGGLVGVVDGRRVVVLRQGGSVAASARFRSGDVAGESGLVASPDGAAVVFAVTRARSEGIELLRAGARRARTLWAGTVRDSTRRCRRSRGCTRSRGGG